MIHGALVLVACEAPIETPFGPSCELLGSHELARAACLGATQQVRALLDQGAEVNGRGTRAWTALHWAAAAGRTDVAETLIAAGANVDARAQFDMRPLHWAALRGHAGSVELLLAAGARPEAVNLYGLTPLHEAKSGAVARALLAAGASVSAVDQRGMTPLHLARSPDVAGPLIAAGANMLAAAQNGVRPVDMTAATSESWFELALYPQEKTICMLGDVADFTVTVRNLGTQPHNNLQVALQSDRLVMVRSQPAVLETLQPGQQATFRATLERLPEIEPGSETASLRLGNREQPVLLEVEVEADTRPDCGQRQRRGIRVAEVEVRPAPSRWWWATYLAVPALLIVGWLVVRRR